MSFLSFRYKFPAIRVSTTNQRKESVEVTDEEEGAKYIFTYHPSCVIANTKQYINNEEYEEAIIKLIMEQITE